MKFLLRILIFVCSNLPLCGQTANYDIYLGSIKVGSQTVRQFTKNNLTSIEVKGNATLSLGFTYHLNIYQLSQFDGQKLITSKAEISKNNDIYTSASTDWRGNSYHINHNDKTSNYPSSINYFSTKLYFDEPANISEVYSETDCVTRPIKKSGTNTYLVLKPYSKRNNEYYYEDGILQTATARHLIVDLTIKLVSYEP